MTDKPTALRELANSLDDAAHAAHLPEAPCTEALLMTLQHQVAELAEAVAAEVERIDGEIAEIDELLHGGVPSVIERQHEDLLNEYRQAPHHDALRDALERLDELERQVGSG